MKKILSIILVAILCLGVFVACNKTEAPAATLEDAKTYLEGMYKDSASDLSNDYDLVGKVIVNGVTFTVTWTSNVSEITIKESTKKDFWTVDLPDVNAAEKAYVLTATITDAEGKTVTTTLNRKLPVYEKVAGVVTTPVANTAYKLFFKQANIGKTLFLTTEDTGKFIKTIADPKKAPDFYVDVVDGGVKIYTTVNNTKTYITAAAVLGSDGKVSKSITFGGEGSVFKYNSEINAWFTVIDNIKYCMGTYSTYDTVSISEDSYYTAENTGVEQFPVEFISKADGEALAPTEGPADPTELTSIEDVLAIAGAKEHNQYTVEKYLVKGTITEIATDKNTGGLSPYGNMYITDGEGNSIYIYGLYSKDGSVRFDKMDPQPKVGDTITVMSIVGQYNNTPQLKNAWLMNLEATVCEHTYSGVCDTTCDKCQATREAAAHTYDNACDAECNVCAVTRTPAAHVYDNDCDADCNVCAATRTPAEHVYTDECKAACSVCGAANAEATHTYDDECDVQCNVCNAERTVPHKYVSDCDINCDLCGAVRETSTAHTYAFDCDADCNICGATRVAECKDEAAPVDGKCDICGEDMPDQSVVENNHITYEKGQVATFYAFTTLIKKSQTITLPTVKQYPDVTITWKSGDKAVTEIVIAKNDAEQTITLTATFVCGGTTVTETYTIKVAAHVYDNACDADCNDCGATRTPAAHVYDNCSDVECNVCKVTNRTAAECADNNNDGKCDKCGATASKFPDTSAEYKLYVVHGGLENKTLYFSGAMSGFYFATTSDVESAANVRIENATNGYYLCLTKDGEKLYVNIIKETGSDGKEHLNVKIEGNAITVYTLDKTLNTFVTVIDGTTYCLGAVGTYTTFGAYDIASENAPYACQFFYVDPDCAHTYSVTCDAYCDLCGKERTGVTHTDANGDNSCDNCNAIIDESKGVTVNAALNSADGTVVTITGTISKIYEAYNSQHNNTAFYLTDNNGDTILCYRVTGEWAVGDVVTVTGSITTRSGSKQIAQGGTAEKIGTHTEHVWNEATCTDPKSCKICGTTEGNAKGHGAADANGKCSVCGEDLAVTEHTLSFADKANRTNFTEDQQIWAQDGITLTNNQGSSTSKVADYANPARFYKSSQIIIDCTGMTKIVFHCNSASYATALASSITGAEANGKDVTVTLSEKVNTYTIESLTGGQVRLDSISVYTK